MNYRKIITALEDEHDKIGRIIQGLKYMEAQKSKPRRGRPPSLRKKANSSMKFFGLRKK